VESRKWKVESEKWKAKSEKWKVESEKRKVKSEEWGGRQTVGCVFMAHIVGQFLFI
jgi:hypothetical protein